MVRDDAPPPGPGRRGDPRPPDRETSVRRALEVLLALGSDDAVAGGGLGVTRIAEGLGREKSQVSRTLRTLAEYGLVDRHPDTRAYRLGWRIHALAAVAGERRLLEMAPPVLAALVDESGERAFLSVLQGPDTLTVLSHSPPRSLQAVDPVGRRTPAWCTAAGRALLVDHHRTAIDRLFAGVHLRPFTPRTVTTVDEVAERIDAARRRGWALVEEELEPGLASVAAPVRDGGDRVVAAVNVSGPAFRLGAHTDAVVDAVVRAAGRISASLRAPG